MISTSTTSTPTTIAVDANGADLGPKEVCLGALFALNDSPLPLKITIFGPAQSLTETITGSSFDQKVKSRLIVCDAPLSIAKTQDPAAAIRNNPESSIVQTIEAVSSGQADAFVAGGSTGVALAAGLLGIKRARGIYRPAIALPVPTPTKPFVMLDVGANTHVRAEHLTQFAYMGAALAEMVFAIKQPSVALLANGIEESRGTEITQATYKQLQQQETRDQPLNFIGYVEGNTITREAADVVVTDGFTGNVALKTMEGVSQTIFSAVRKAAHSSTRAKLGGFLLQPAVQNLKTTLDPENVGGAYLLGLKSIGVIPHGHFTSLGFSQAIQKAAQAVESGLINQFHHQLEEAQALRKTSR